MYKHILSGFALTSALLLTSQITPAYSDPAEDMNSWKQEASKLVSKHMTYPRIRYAQQNVLHEVDILISASGEILNTGEIEGRGLRSFRAASERTINKLEKLPALPTSFASDKAVVKVRMIYTTSEDRLKQILRQLEKKRPSVRIQDVASNDIPVIELAAN
ncbi:MAG: hypothetical protein PVF65_03020 [Sphingomonadales bacterium]|jgi:hypothetical protein